jgi:hypothetical protein
MNLYVMQPTIGGPSSYGLHETDEEALECAARRGAEDVIKAHENLDEWVYVIDGDWDVFKVGPVTKVGTAKARDAANDPLEQPLGEMAEDILAEHGRESSHPRLRLVRAA